MGATRNVAKNTALLTFGLLSGRALSFYLLTKMAPVLGPEGIGIWAVATDLSLILLVVTRFGLDTLLTREVTRAKGNTLPLFWATLRVRWAVAAFCYLFLLLFVRIENYDSILMTAVLVAGVGIFVESTSMACDSVLQAHDKVQYQSLGQIVSAVVYFALGWIWLDMGYGLMGIIWANLISKVVRLLIMAPLMLMKTGPWRWRDPDGSPPPELMWLVRLGFPLLLANTFGIIYNKIDTLMLKNMLDASSVGVYTLGHRALDMMIILPNLFGTAFFPTMARYAQTSSADAVRMGERALRFMMVAVVPATLFVTFISVPIINLFDDGADFADSHKVLMIVIWALPFQAANILFNRLIITAGREKVFIVIGLVPMIANIIMNALLIPRYGYFGASVATIISYGISFSMLVGYLNRTEFRVPLFRAVVMPLVATGAAWLSTSALGHLIFPAWDLSWLGLPLNQGWVPFIVMTGLMIVLYCVVLAGLRVVGAKDLNLLKELVNKG